MKQLFVSLRQMDFRTYWALLFLGLCPAVYQTARVFFLGQLPNAYAYSVAGQLGWVSLIYEVLREAVILPLFYFLSQAAKDKKSFENRVKTGLLVSFLLFSGCSLLLMIFVRPLLLFMAAEPAILEEAAVYIRIESAAQVLGILNTFALTALLTLNREKYVYVLTAVQTLLSLLCDVFFVSELHLSLNLGVNGVGISNLLTGGVLFLLTLYLLHREQVCVFSRGRMQFGWMKSFWHVGGFSGLESLVRNGAYLLMVIRMVNAVGEQGTYWVANGFIWNWLLLPVLQLGVLVKKETAAEEHALRKKLPAYFFVTGCICLLWLFSIPLWKPFMTVFLGYQEVDKLFSLVLLLLGFYVVFAFQNIFDAVFYGLGKTNYMLFESVITNLIYYGGAYLLFSKGLWTPTLQNIALLFGIGIAFDGLVSAGAFFYLLRKRQLASGSAFV